MVVFMFVVYAVSRPFGAAAQAGVGIGLRLVQAFFLPVVALGFSVAPVAGQNVGARRFDRVRETLRAAIGLSVSLMLAVGVVIQFPAAPMVGVFSGIPPSSRSAATTCASSAWASRVGDRVRDLEHVPGARPDAAPAADLHRPERRRARADSLAGIAARLQARRSSGISRWARSWSTPRPTSCSCSARSDSWRRHWFPDRHAFAVP